MLVPTLSPGDVVVMDTPSSHKGQSARDVIEGAGCDLLVLPPHSPDLNPIELAFSKLKAHLRTHAERSMGALWRRIGALIDDFTANERRNSFITPDPHHSNREPLQGSGRTPRATSGGRWREQIVPSAGEFHECSYPFFD